MEDFKGMSRDTVRSKTPPMKWEFARNILLSKGFLSVTNEDGFDYKHSIPGEFIGKIETNEEVVYFSVDDQFSYIGYYKTNEEVSVYIPVLKTIYLNFKINRPIEGIYYYNYKGELIITFCDGVFIDSNTPKLINLFNLGFPVTGTNELVSPSDAILMELTPFSREGGITITYSNSISIDIDIAYITYSYVKDGETDALFYFPIHTIAYPEIDFKNKYKRTVNIFLSTLDSRYHKLKLGIIINTDAGLVAYESAVYNIEGGAFTTSITSLKSFTSISVESLIVPSIFYSRVNTMTVNNNRLEIGNIVGEDSIDFQKYANLLKLGLKFHLRDPQYQAEPTLCPDEVYSFTISLQRLSGTYTEEFHIPGEQAVAFYNDLVVLSNGDLTAMGLQAFVDNPPLNTPLKRFQLINSGGWVNPSYAIPNLGTVESDLRWGYWENKELYPNDDNYNSLLDYNGSPIVGGEDLRGTPVRYHRVPGLDSLVVKFACVLGKSNINAEVNPFNNGTLFTANPLFNGGAVPNFAIKVLNFDTIVPTTIKNKIQGFRISIVKRQTGNKLVEDINYINPLKVAEVRSLNSSHIIMDSPSFSSNDYGQTGNGTDPYALTHFGSSNIISNTLSIYKPKINKTLIKANYAYTDELALRDISTYGIGHEGAGDITNSSFRGQIGEVPVNIETVIEAVPSSEKSDYCNYYLIPATQKYAYLDRIEYLPANNGTLNNFFNRERIRLYAKNSLQTRISPIVIGNSPNDFLDIEYVWNPLLVPTATGYVGGGDARKVNTSIDLEGYKLSAGNGSYITSKANYEGIGISSTILNIRDNLYEGLLPTEFVTIGKINGTSGTSIPTLVHGGDIFTNNCYSAVHIKLVVDNSGPTIDDSSVQFYPEQRLIKGMISIPNNSQVYNSISLTNNNKFIQGLITIDELSVLNTYDYTNIIYNNESLRSLNDLITGIAFNYNKVFIDYFPYRIQSSLTIQSESLSTNNIRKFLANAYYDMPSDRGEIIALRGSNKTLYIQQKFSLFVASVKDRLNTSGEVTYLGEAELFDRTPDEILDASNKGYLGSTSKFGCFLYKNGYVVIDQVKGKIFAVSGQQSMEISKVDMIIWFSENSNTDNKFQSLNRLGRLQVIDNPYTQVGHTIGFDGKYNRLLFTKKAFEFKETLGGIYTFDGDYYYQSGVRLRYADTTYFNEISTTFSYSLDNGVWVCEHDYFPSSYLYTTIGLFSVTNTTTLAKTYKHNSLLNKGTFYGNTFDSYVDLIFNSRPDLSKLYQNVSWGTLVQGVNNDNYLFKTIDAIMLYNDFQSTGIINIPDNTLYISRNLEGEWNFNEFRDVVINRDFPLIDKEGKLIITNINNNGSWFEKSNFIYIFIVVRMIMRNETNKTVYINHVNVKSRMSDRV